MKIPRPSWGVGIAAVYAVFATSTLAFVAFAIAQPVELVSPDFYRQALTFDGRQAAMTRADALGSSLEIEAAGHDVTVRIAGQPAASGAITLYRPSNAGADYTVRLALDAQGTQRIAAAHLADGRWIVKLSWADRGLEYYREQPVDLR